MAFGRLIEMDIGRNNNTGVRISSLNVSFDILRSSKSENNSGKFTIYNTKDQTRNNILIKGNNIIVRCGYKDENNLGIIFFGIIQESTSRKEGDTIISDIFASDFGNNLENKKSELINFNYSALTPFSAVIGDISAILSVPVIGLQNVSDIILNNGFVFYGTAVNAIKQLQKKLISSEIGLYFDLGEMVIYRKGTQDSRFGIVNISPTSGLLGEVQDITEKDDATKRIKFYSLMNPKLKPNSVVRITSNKLSGAFILENVNYKGDNFGGDFVVECEALV